ncbi:MAG TPA: ABC transporter permease [Blastocatellia bacterium]|nr:ABC transporter permease [Blastocatellia bacterium]
MLRSKRRKPTDFSEEIRSHLQIEIDRLMEQGLAEPEARAAALKTFGNLGIVQEQFYESSPWSWWDTLIRDVRFGLRMLRRDAGLTVVVAVTMMLGVGASTGLFSISDAVLRKDPTWRRTGAVIGREPRQNQRIFRFSIPEFVELSKLTGLFETCGALYWSNAALTTGDYPERVGCAHVTSEQILTEGAPEFGRFFGPGEDKPGGPQVAVLSDEFWRSHLGANPGIVGSRVKLDGLDYTVIGITPAHKSEFGSDIMVPAQLNLADQNRSRRVLWVLVVLREGISWEQADARLTAVARNMADDYRLTHPEYAGLQLSFWNGYEANTGGIRPVLLLLLGAVALLLVISCANIATLLLARASKRMPEFTMRAALGARRGRLVRQLLTEGLLLAAAGGIAGVLSAHWCLPLLLHLIPAPWLPSDQIHLNARVLALASGITLLIGISFGLAPAWICSRAQLADALKSTSRTGGNREGWTRRVLVVLEIALTVVVLAGALLMVQSYRKMEHIDLGFNPDHVLTFQLSLPERKYPAAADVAAFFRKAIDRVGALQGVDGAAAVSGVPMLDRTVDLATRDLTIEGRPVENGTGGPNANFRLASTGYFDVIGARLISGRVFDGKDGAGAQPVAVINETMARLYWPDADPIGARLHLAADSSGQTDVAAGTVVTIVGVVSDLKQIRVIEAPVRQEFYLPEAQFAELGRGLTMMVRSDRDAASFTPAIRREIASLDPELPVYQIETMNQVVADSFGPKRIATVLLGFFAVVAILLSTLGVYAVMAYSVTQRKREVGIRMALGARPDSILRLIMRDGAVIALAGLALGVVLALILAKLTMSIEYGVTAVGLFYGVTSLIPVVLVVISAALLCVALAACLLPARRAMRVSPVEALRCD